MISVTEREAAPALGKLLDAAESGESVRIVRESGAAANLVLTSSPIRIGSGFSAERMREIRANAEDRQVRGQSIVDLVRQMRDEERF